MEVALPMPDLRERKVGMRRTDTGLTSLSHSVRGGARMETWPDVPTQFTETLSVSPCTRTRVCVCVHNCVWFCNYIDCSSPGSSVHGILQARILEWVAISSSRGSSWPRDQTQVSCVSCISKWSLYLSHLYVTCVCLSCSVVSDSMWPHGL